MTTASYWIQELRENYRNYRPESYFRVQQILNYLRSTGIINEIPDDEYDEIYDIETEVHDNKSRFAA